MDFAQLAYVEGKQAFAEGKTPSANPYDENIETQLVQYRRWKDGWLFAKETAIFTATEKLRYSNDGLFFV